MVLHFFHHEPVWFCAIPSLPNLSLNPIPVIDICKFIYLYLSVYLPIHLYLSTYENVNVYIIIIIIIWRHTEHEL